MDKERKEILTNCSAGKFKYLELQWYTKMPNL